VPTGHVIHPPHEGEARVRKTTALSALGTAVAAAAVVLGAAAAGNAASGSPAKAAAPAHAASAKPASLIPAAEQLAEKAVTSDYGVTATVISASQVNATWYLIELKDSGDVHEFAVLVDPLAGTTGGIKELPGGTFR
jgi:hypothetical protein